MAVIITNRTITDKLRPSSDVNWSLFTIGEPLTITIDFEVFTYKTFTENSPLQYGHAPSANTYALANSSGRLSDINVGDEIKIVDGATTFIVTVMNVLSPNLIITDYDFGSYSASSTAVIYNITPITGVGMPYGFIENAEILNFNSKVDGSFQKMYAIGLDAANTTPIPMVFDGLLPYQTGSATIEGVSYDTTTGKQVFRIIHETTVTPIYLANQLVDTQNEVAPTYYFNSRCLKHVYRIEAYGVYSNPNSRQWADCIQEIGNSGWFNEVFNGSARDYIITDVEINGSATDKLRLDTTAQTIEFNINGTTGDFNNPYNILLGWAKLPNNQSEYQGNSRTFDENFLFTNTLLTEASIDFTPSTVGTTYESCTNVKYDYVNSNQLHITMTIQFNDAALAVMNESLTPRYTFWITLSNFVLTTAATQNKQAIYSGVYETYNPSVADIVVIYPKFLRHYENVNDAGVEAGITTIKEDECVMYSSIFLFPLNFPLPTVFTKVTQQIVAKKNNGREFVIEDFQFNPSQVFSGDYQITNFSGTRVFQIPTTEPRKNVTISNCYADGDKIRFDIAYGFMIRWEYWIALIGANTDFYDINYPQNGLNQDWFRYQNADWGVYFRTVIDITYNGIPMSYKLDNLIEINDYESNVDFTTKDVESYTMSGNSLFDSVNSRWYIQSFANTQIKATFEKNAPLNINLCYVVFGIEIFEQGGIAGRQRYSSKWATNNPLTCFIPLTGISGNKVELTQPASDTIVAKAVIDHTLLPQGNIIYKIVARLYENDGSAGNKITEDGIDKFTEDDEQKIIE